MMDSLSPGDHSVQSDEQVEVVSSPGDEPAPKKSKTKDDLPVELRTVNLRNGKDFVVCKELEIKKTVVIRLASRHLPKKELKVGSVHLMAVEVRIPPNPPISNEEKVFRLDDIGINPLREFAKGFGVTRVSYFPKQGLQYLIANSIKMSAIIDSSKIVDPLETERKKRNTLLRMINIFDPEFQQLFLSLNMLSHSVSLQQKTLLMQQETLELSRKALELSRESTAAKVQKSDIYTYRNLLEMKEKFKTHRYDKKIADFEAKYDFHDDNERSEEST